MRHDVITKPSACLLIWLLVLPTPAAAAELKPEAVQGFEQYVQLTERRIQNDLQPGGTFLWVGTLPEAHRREAAARLRAVSLPTAPARDRAKGRGFPPANGRPHAFPPARDQPRPVRDR